MATRLIFDCDRCGERGIPGPGIPFRVSRDNEADEFESDAGLDQPDGEGGVA